jgi:hypothetical protein
MKSLKNIYSFDEYLNEASMEAPKGPEVEHYMFFDNLKSIMSHIESLMNLDPTKVDEMLNNGHDWAADHISVAKENIEQVSHFFENNK